MHFQSTYCHQSAIQSMPYLAGPEHLLHSCLVWPGSSASESIGAMCSSEDHHSINIYNRDLNGILFILRFKYCLRTEYKIAVFVYHLKVRCNMQCMQCLTQNNLYTFNKLYYCVSKIRARPSIMHSINCLILFTL